VCLAVLTNYPPDNRLEGSVCLFVMSRCSVLKLNLLVSGVSRQQTFPFGDIHLAETIKITQN